MFREIQSRLAYRRRLDSIPTIELDSQKNILIITVDCLRYDRISRTGYRRETTPFLDSLSSFTSAIAPAPWTFSAVPSILTGLYPHNHGAIYPDDSMRNQDLNDPPSGVHDDVHTLAELLAANGYETRMDTAIGTAAIPISGRFKAIKRHHDTDAGTLLSTMQDWWNSTDEPKFSYVQLGDLHEPLHEPETTYFGDIPSVDGIDRWRYETGQIDTPEFEAYRSARELLYDTLVRYVDTQIELTVDNLAGMNDTIVIVTSDHGEEFWEYKEFEEDHFEDPRGISGVGHGHALVPPVLEVPIATNLDTISNHPDPVSSVDIVPTILQELGGDDSLSLDGVPLQESDHDEPVLSQEIAYGPNQISVTDHGDHLIYVPARDDSILIDWETGEELHYKEREMELLDNIPTKKTQGSEVTLSINVQEQLSDLGYAE